MAQAHRYVWAHFDELDAIATETLERVRHLELIRLDRYIAKLEKLMRADGAEPDVIIKAISAAKGLMDRRAKLQGLDAPAKVEHRELPSEYLEQTPAERIAAHEAAIAEERAKLEEKAGGTH